MHEGSRKSRLQRLLRRAEGRSLVTLTAATGWGTTHLARLWAETTGATLLTLPPREVDEDTLLAARRGPEQTTTTLAEILASSDVENWLILDGIDHLAPSAEAKLSQWLDHEHRPTLLTSSRPLDHFAGGRWALELGAHHLQLDLAEVSAWLRQDLGDDAPAARVLSVTHGWPAAVQVIIDELHDHPTDDRLNLVHRTTRPQGRLGRFFRTAMANLEAAHQRALVVLALLGPTAEPHLATLIPDAGTVLSYLTRAGWVVADPQTTVLAPLPGMVELLRSPDHLDQECYATLVDDIVDLQLEHEPAAAVLTLTRHRRPTRLAEVLSLHGDALLRAGKFAALSTAATSLSTQKLDTDTTRIYAHALAYRGNWREALRQLEPVLVDGPLPAALALVLGHLHHFRGATTEALAAYERAIPAQSTAWAEVLGWRSGAHWLLGQAEPARHFAQQAYETAAAVDSDSALAVAHTALAMVALRDGDWHKNGEHYELALAAADLAGDQPARARILTNLGSRHIENGEYAIGRELTEQAISLAEEQGFAMVSALARCNRAEVFLRMGVIDGAVADAEISRDAYARFGSPAEAYAHCILGDARREQGRLIQARIAYERALDLAQESGDRQSKTHALIGLSRTLADTDPSRAREAAERAVEVDPGVMAVEARLSKAWVDLALGEADEAIAAADAAWEESRVRDNRAGLAEAATLRAVADDDPVPGLREAAHLWREVNAHVNATRVELGLARRTEPGSVAAMSLTNELSEAGCSPQGGTFVDRLITGIEHCRPWLFGRWARSPSSGTANLFRIRSGVPEKPGIS